MKVWLARMQVGSTASLPLYSTQVSKTANKAISNPPGHISLLLCSNESIKKKKKKSTTEPTAEVCYAPGT